MVVAGGVLIATGVGGPAGLMLVSAGADTLIQRATTGQVNWGQVAVAGVAGAVGFGAGAAVARTAGTGLRGSAVHGIRSFAGRSLDHVHPVPAAPTAADAAQAVSPTGIRFSQTSVNGVAEIEASMRANGWVGDAVDVVRMQDGGLTSVDNTRLLAARRAGVDVQARLHDLDEVLPQGQAERFLSRKGAVPETWGKVWRVGSTGRVLATATGTLRVYRSQVGEATVGNLLTTSDLPPDFAYPRTFVRVVELGLTNIEPWLILEGELLARRFTGLQERFPARQLIPFACRMDNDDVACWEVGGEPGRVIVIHDYASPGWERRAELADFDDWLRQAVEDLIEFES